MDYQTFSSPQHLPPAFGGFSSSAPTHSPQQQPYADPQARLQQSNPSFPYAHAQFANGQPGGFPSSMPSQSQAPTGGGAMMQLGGLSQSQLHQARGKPPDEPPLTSRAAVPSLPLPSSPRPTLTRAMSCSPHSAAAAAVLERTRPRLARPPAVPPRPLAVQREQQQQRAPLCHARRPALAQRVLQPAVDEPAREHPRDVAAHGPDTRQVGPAVARVARCTGPREAAD